jgi:cytochrome b
MARLKVWDRVVRGLHWLLVLTVVAAWVTGHWPKSVHEALGYGAAGIVFTRLVWGFCGSPYARFAQFVRGPRATWQYTRLLARGAEPRTLGHNPLGAWMIVLLLACIAGLCLTGFLYTTDWLYGYAWLEALHSGLAWILLVLVLGHLAGVAFTSLRHRENLVVPMFTGYKRAADDDTAEDRP